MPDDEFQPDHPGLNRLSEANVVCDQQVDSGHLDGPDYRIKLVVLDLYAGAERRLDVLVVGGGSGPPPDGIQEGVKVRRGVQAARVRESHLFDDLRPRLNLPHHLKLFAQPVIFDRGEGQEVLRAGTRHLHGGGGQAARLDVVHHPRPRTDLNQLALFRRSDGSSHAFTLSKDTETAPHLRG